MRSQLERDIASLSVTVPNLTFDLNNQIFMFVSCIPDIEALSIRQHREGSTQRPFGADKHDPAVVNTN